MKLADLPSRAVVPLGISIVEMPRREARSRNRAPNKTDPLTRGFVLACMIRDGLTITTELIRRRFEVSAETAKRDKAAALRLARQYPPAARPGSSGVIAGRREIVGFTSRFDGGLIPDTRTQVKGRVRNA